MQKYLNMRLIISLMNISFIAASEAKIIIWRSQKKKSLDDDLVPNIVLKEAKKSIALMVSLFNVC